MDKILAVVNFVLSLAIVIHMWRHDMRLMRETSEGFWKHLGYGVYEKVDASEKQESEKD